MRVVGHDNWHNGHTGLDGQVESTLLEGQEGRVLGVATGALGKHVDTLLARSDLFGGTAYGLPGVLGVLAVNEDGSAQRHEPAQEGPVLERLLGCYAAVLGEHAAEHENVEFGLVVADEDGRAHCIQVVAGVADLEGDAGSSGHDILECARGGPLRDLLHADEAQCYRGQHSVEGDGHQGHVRGQRAGHEARLGHGEGQHVEGDGEGDLTADEVCENVEQCHLVESRPGG